MTDLPIIIVLAVGTCLATGLLGAAVLYLVRRRSLRYQLMIATLLPVLAVAATVLINIRLMLLSSHDSTVILIGLVTSVVLAVLGAWLVMRRITAASREVGLRLHQLVTDTSTRSEPGLRTAAGSRTAPQELARVLDDLVETRTTLAASRARERAAEDARRELVSFMSHDLRTPLAGLRALAEALEDGVIADVPRALGHLRGTVSRMTVLVDDLFALSRVQGAGEPKPQALVSLTELIADVASESTPTAQTQGVRLDVQLPTDDRLAVLGSADDLARALANLVFNAIRHTEQGRTVRLEAARVDDGHLQVAVVDGCGGIPAESIQRVFDTGWRGTPSRGGEDGGGAGLGLAIARGVVESHAGRIGVRNIDGGCRFEVDLPSSARRGADR